MNTTSAKGNPLLKLPDFGQSIWLDYLRRDLVSSGQLRRLIEEDGLRGMTSNPSIFEKAIADSELYDVDIRSISSPGKNANAIYEALSQDDIRDAADAFRSLYTALDARDGYVSLEVSPHLAHDSKRTIEEARRLWKALDRPNVFIKVPATREGIIAIRQLVSEGINVNITLLFGLPRYREVAAAYLEGIEARLDQGKAVNQVASVASFFVSRMDALIDPILDELTAQDGEASRLAKKSLGQVAIANAKIAYQIYRELFESDRFERLAQRGARVQRLLWASTSTKNPRYDDLKYVEALIGPNTINTVPVETLDAYRDHGHPEARLEQHTGEAQSILNSLPKLGINIDQITQQLEDEGVAKFNQAFDKLMGALAKKSDHGH